jgi:hypothetical protein
MNRKGSLNYNLATLFIFVKLIMLYRVQFRRDN